MRYMVVLCVWFVFLLPLLEVSADSRGLQLDSIEDESGQPITLYHESYALLIGISDYTGRWPDLPGVKDDVQAVKTALEAQGFQVITEENSDRERLDQVFMDFITTYGQQPDNRLVFYFAGHGHTVTLAYGDDMGYIIPADAPNPNTDHAGSWQKPLICG